jgi:hypothetical protein
MAAAEGETEDAEIRAGGVSGAALRAAQPAAAKPAPSSAHAFQGLRRRLTTIRKRVIGPQPKAKRFLQRRPS